MDIPKAGPIEHCDTYQDGNYRVVIFDLADDPDIQEPAIFRFELFKHNSTSLADPGTNAGKYGTANISFMMCGMVVSDEKLYDITLPIDIHKTPL